MALAFYCPIMVAEPVLLAPMLKPVQQAARILIWQLGWTVLGAVIFGMLVSGRWAWSIAVGAGIGLLATAYVALVMIKHLLNVTKPATLFTVLITWLIKTMLVVGLLLLALRSHALVPLAVILGLSGSLVVYWFSVVMYSRG